MDSTQLQTQAPPGVQPDHARPLTVEESAEFARALGVRPEAVHSWQQEQSEAAISPETYEQLVADPIKSLLASSQEFFAEIKCDIVREVVSSHFREMPAEYIRALDVGCGSGVLMRWLSRYYPQVRGCDPSAAMVRRAGEHALRMPGPTELPYETNAFHVVVCACVYHHIPASVRAAHLAEIRRVLMPGGLLMIFEHNPLNPLTRRIVRRCPLDESAELLSGGLARRLLHEAGFSSFRNRYYLFLPERLYRAIGRAERWLSLTRLGGQYCAVGVNR